MKAWERAYRLLQEANPVVLDEEEQTWLAMNEVEKFHDMTLKLFWHSNVPGSGAPEMLAVAAVQSMHNMGYETDHLLPLLDAGEEAYSKDDMAELQRITARLMAELNRLPKNEQSNFWTYTPYTTWEAYEQKAKFPSYGPYDVKAEDFASRIYAGWLAQIVGGALGTAIEGYTSEKLKAKFGDIRHYVRKPNTYNDDITFEIAFLSAFDKQGYEVTSDTIAEEWVALVPSGWSAEEIALKNIRTGIYPPESGYRNNPFREWIGAQMRGAICGMVAPGNPKEAARLAWKDGVVSHAGNGVLGEIFNAVFVSLAFVEKDIRKIVELSVEAIPSDSEYYDFVSTALEWCRQHEDWQQTWALCEEKFKEYNWIHAYPNAMAEVVALWYGNGDFDETLHIIAMVGQDVDCNAAQIVSALGIMNGLGTIDSKWTDPIGDLDTYLRGLKKMKITELSDWTVGAVRKHSV
ncbi:ADP-ribosylglycohydrolase family protein [Paenibacillus spongiae]|uniref:ADP-ribosylglycohydrolase family protein n=1 Tax=Paenibacillus spongiae TaxID=2909671 RepID=A0ABY5S897_9BACL|nr:ADP-ribosylglycohydrolase family protein [Paenibacillus spongiae]UVI30141.1 ADP-ribosylglycohydrolase family protein [Paenibacillus spongiae]